MLLETRLKLNKLSLIFFDALCIFFFIFNTFNLIEVINVWSYKIPLTILVYLFINYTIGKYNCKKEINIKSNLAYVTRKILISFLFLSLISIVLNLFFEYFNFLEYSFFNLLIKLSVLSLISELFLKLILKNFKLRKLKVYILGDLEDRIYVEKIVFPIHFNKESIDINLIENINMILGLTAMPDYLLIPNNSSEKHNLNQIKRFCHSKNIKVFLIKDWFFRILKRIPSKTLTDDDIRRFNSSKKNLYTNSFIKRLGDIFVSSSLIILLFILLILASFLIWIDDGYPILYSQIRNGLNGKKIKIYKLRTMIKDAEKSGVQWAKKDDHRVTRTGSFLRKCRIDELPQLFSVLKGEMSLIGPRPERPLFDKDLAKKIPNYSLKMKIKPGLSGWAQVCYPYGASVEDARNKLSFDNYYIFNSSLKLDIIILIKTINLVLNGSGSIPGERVI